MKMGMTSQVALCTAALCLPPCILIISMCTFASAAAVNANEAKALPANVTRSGVSTSSPPGKTGSVTATPTVHGIPSTNSPGSSGAQTLQVNPVFHGGEMDNRIIPDSSEPTDSRNTVCVYQNSGDSKMVVELYVTFQGQADTDYVITWNNREFAAKWRGLISLPAAESTGKAKFKAYSYHPWESTGTAGTKVLVYLESPAGGNPGKTEWSHQKNGPDTTTINEDSGLQILRDPNLAPDEAPNGLSTVFTKTASIAGAVQHDCRTALEVVIGHDVSAHLQTSGQTYISQTKDTNDTDRSWIVYGWKLNVSVSRP